MTAPKEITALVERFDRNREAYRSSQYNETQLRREFLDPFFEALGWDVTNKAGYAEAYKDVIHEDAIKVGGYTKAPDYCFRIGGTRKFFVEAKKPAVDIKEGIDPAYQLRRYAWSAKLPLSILTDFEEFAVYDCRMKPAPADKASTARTIYATYTEYPQRWDEIASVFSREAVLKGSFDRYVESSKAKKGTAEVDDAFLEEIESWRDLLARHLALRNPDLTQRELNFSVQRIIDRLIFLRICEDRGIEEYGKLMAQLNGDEVYARLCQLFQRADERYNSGLFHFRQEKGRAEPPDELTLRLAIDDKPLKEIIKNLYYPDSPYEFSVLPADILGQVYEQFLGKVIRLTAGHRAVVEDKPEVKKAGGVYYTPTYIVDYIVKNTVGELLKGKTPKQVAKLRILDPACGSGSFLIGAYQTLLDWHRDWYVKNGPRKWAIGRCPVIYQASGGDWRLTTAERKRILINNIYGVDIDPQAAEVTKLSLLLKVLEGENEQTLNRQLVLLHERALPDLGSNIKCGNSLISPDFYETYQMGLFDEEDRYRINVFSWDVEFPQVFHGQNGGFNAVIGNPPWISLSGKFGVDLYSKSEIDHLTNRFGGNTYMPNMYEYFVSLGLRLTHDGGYFSFVVPDRLGFNSQFVQLRKRILSETRIISLLYKVPFPGITADTLIFVLHRGKATKDHSVHISEYGKQGVQRPQAELLMHTNHAFEYFESAEVMQVLARIDASPKIIRIKDFCDSTSGFGGKAQLIQETRTSVKQIRTIKGDSIGRYEMRKKYWFDFKKDNVTGRTVDPSKLGASPKILLRKTGDRIIATYDDSSLFPEQSLYFLYNNRSEMDFRFVLGILNSRLLTYYYRAKSLTNIRSIAQVKKVDLDQLPIISMDMSIPEEKDAHDRMVQLVEQMLSLHKELAEAKTEHDKSVLYRQIESTDEQIDRQVYALYGVTKEDIKIIEGQDKQE